MFRSDIVPFVKFDIIKDAPTIKYLAIIINPFYTNWSLGREWGVSHTLYAHNNTLSIKESDWRREKEGMYMRRRSKAEVNTLFQRSSKVLATGEKCADKPYLSYKN